MKKVYYLGYYDDPQKAIRRNSVLAATNKMTYIVSALNRAGYAVDVISISGADHFERGSLTWLNEMTRLKLFTTFGSGFKLKRVLSRWFLKCSWFFYLLCHVHKNDTVLVYHSLGYMPLIRLLKKIIGFRLVLEIEEIYADVLGNKQIRLQELDFFQLGDAYLFPTELLNQSVNRQNKPSVIIYGTYQVEPERNKYVFNDTSRHGKRHLLYAGTFDPRKGGAGAAVAAAEFMPSNYDVHILGFGSKQDRLILEETIRKVNASDGARVTLDGLLSGEDYICFLQSCDVGFSTQIPDASFNNTSFPSKILSYLANGLRVVSVRISVLEKSAVSHLINYYDGSDPRAIAEAVKKIDWDAPYDSRSFIRELDEKFVSEIKELLLW